MAMVQAADLDPVTARALSRLGITLKDKWHLDYLLGVGGMASVYAATHRNGKRVAVKMLHPELSIDQNIRGRFLREGYVANKVAHAGAVSVIDDDTAEDGSVYLVMDLLEGETLDARARRCGDRLEPGDVLSCMDQLLDVLAAAHDKGIIHRDIKPENLFLTRDGQIKVLDFGIARVKELSTKSTATKTGATMGTPAFMPPEQARGRWDEVDARSDLWAVGASMYALLSGRFVHEAQTTNEQLLAAMTARASSIASVVPGLPPQMIGLVDKALSYHRKDRWSDARSMQNVVRISYQALIGNPIGTAPRLSVPDEIVTKTFYGRSSGNAGGTGDPFTAGQTGVELKRKALNPFILAAGVGLAATVAGTIVGLRLIGSAQSTSSVSATVQYQDVNVAADALTPPTTPDAASAAAASASASSTSSLKTATVPVPPGPRSSPNKPATTMSSKPVPPMDQPGELLDKRQ